MKKAALLLSIIVAPLILFSQPLPVNFTGSTTVSSGSTVTYTTDIPDGFYIYWGVTNGTIVGSLTPNYIVNNSSSVTIKWADPACGTNLTGSISVLKFSTWPPSGNPSYNGGLSVTIQGYSCPPPAVPTCASVQTSIDSVWNSTSIPANIKCTIINNIISNAISNGYVDNGCLNRYGC